MILAFLLCLFCIRSVSSLGSSRLSIVRLSDGIPAVHSMRDSAWPGGPHVYLSDAFGISLSAVIVDSKTLGGNSSVSALCALDGRGVIPGLCKTVNATMNSCSCFINGTVGAGKGLHSVALYAHVINSHTVELLGGPIYVQISGGIGGASRKDAEAALRSWTPSGSGRLGTYTTPYVSVPAQIYQNISRLFNKRSVTMEDVIRGGSFINSSVWAYQAAAASPQWASQPSSVYQDAPSLGFYCLYMKRANQTFGWIPDCPEAPAILRAQASLMNAAGIEWVAPDSTNTDADPSAFPLASDLGVLRPMELMADEWAAMRLGGEATPQLSVFAKVSGGPLWRWYLDGFFNNETLLQSDIDLILTTTPSGGDRVFLACANPPYPGDKGYNASTIQEIVSNGGKGGIVAPLMWFSPNVSSGWEAEGNLAYVSQCIVQNSPGNSSSNSSYSYTTDAPWVITSQPCGHRKTPSSPIGAVWTISASIPAGSLALMGHKLGGLFLKKQFWDVFADPGPTDFLMVPSWNEFLANAGGMSEPNTYLTTLGARNDDAARYSIFVDAFTAEHGRSIEPSVADGGRYYALLSSCMRVYRLQKALGMVGDGLGCSIAGEDCCVQHPNETFTLAFSLDSPGRRNGTTPSPDSIATSSAEEAAALEASGWTPICSSSYSAYDGSTTLACVDQSLRWTVPATPPSSFDRAFDLLRGPFILYANTSTSIPGTVPIVRCSVPPSSTQKGTAAQATRHFLDNDGSCINGTGTPVELVGFAAATRSGGFPSALARCYNASEGADFWYHTLRAGPFGTCAGDDQMQATLGFII